FELAPSASLLVVDAIVAGRVARGERWALGRHATRNEVLVDGRLAVADALVLEPRAPGELATRLGRFDALAVVLAVGPSFARCASALTAAAEELPAAPGAPVRAAASPVPGGVLLRCAAATPELLAEFVRRAIAPAADALGAGPLPHHW
ncbi:MAG TPA: urease accessory protein UreD, partial [Anaeromyxobacteraceae bacterium]|nr:urease accessory protein UreD [Anaeromyxobacteraceae bacterium]